MPAKRGSANQTKPKRPPPRPTKKGEERSQEDNVWKEVLQEFLELFMLFFFPLYHSDIDWSKPYVSLDKELIKISEAQGFSNQAADKLFKVSLLGGGEQLLLLHIEVQGYVDENFALRVYDYNDLIRRKYKLDVESFAILSDPDPNFRPDHYLRQGKRKRLLFEFEMVKLLDYRQQLERLEQDDNPFALVVMAHLEAQRLKNSPLELKEVKFRLLKLLFSRGYSRQYVLQLFTSIDWLMLLPAPLEAELQVSVSEYTREVKMPLVNRLELYFREEALREGRQEGRQEGMRTFALTLLEQRFGKVEPQLKSQLEQLSDVQLQELGKQLLGLSSEADLANWLQQHA